MTYEVRGCQARGPLASVVDPEGTLLELFEPPVPSVGAPEV